MDAGDCQSALTGTPITQDTNYLVASVSGGFPPYGVVWSGPGILYTDGASAAVLPTTPGSNIYTVTVIDDHGCVVSEEVEVVLYDVNACHSTRNDKVQVCHVPPGNPLNEHEICIDQSAVPAHLRLRDIRDHGDCYVGLCNSNNPCLATNPAFDPAPACVDLTINILTDNFPTETSWELRENGSVIQSGGNYTLSGTNFTETFCVDPRNCYDVTIFDAFGDGICCGFGLGNWSVDFDGVHTPSPTGGAFGSSENIQVGVNCKTTQAAVEERFSDIRFIVYPNPFEERGYLKFTLPADDEVEVEVFDLQGNRIAVIFQGHVQGEEPYTVSFDGAGLANGVYIFRLTTASGEIRRGHFVLQR